MNRAGDERGTMATTHPRWERALGMQTKNGVWFWEGRLGVLLGGFYRAGSKGGRRSSGN
jgi:hypothetical protein